MSLPVTGEEKTTPMLRGLVKQARRLPCDGDGRGGLPLAPCGLHRVQPERPARRGRWQWRRRRWLEAPIDAGYDGAADAATDAPPACATVAPDNGACASPRSLCRRRSCFNLACDPDNCGDCGHDCAGGSALTGQCRPVTLASNESGPGGLAVDDAGIYWVDNASGEVRVIALDGGGLGTLATGQAGPVGIAVTPTHVYWTNDADSTVQFCLKSACSNSVFAHASHPAYLAVSSSALYWANTGSSASLQGASLSDGGPAIDTDAGGSGFNGGRGSSTARPSTGAPRRACTGLPSRAASRSSPPPTPTASSPSP